MDVQNLHAFLQVAEAGSFSQAAQALHLTQPAVSKRVALLEEQLDSRLFDRIGRSITLTEAGQALLPHVRTVLLALDAAEQSVRDLSGDVTGELLLATSHHIGLHHLAPALRSFRLKPVPRSPRKSASSGSLIMGTWGPTAFPTPPAAAIPARA